MTPIILDDRIINQNLVGTIARIDALKYREDIELLPSQHARITAIALVQQAAAIRPNYFFAPWISGDEEGGVRVVWSRPIIDAQIRLIIPPSARSKARIYHQYRHVDALDYNISGIVLSRYIEWLCKIKDRTPKPEKFGNIIAAKNA